MIRTYGSIHNRDKDVFRGKDMNGDRDKDTDKYTEMSLGVDGKQRQRQSI